MEKFDIPIEKPSEEFQKHLELTGNNRIFFSGKFGSGKTYFLEKFFENNKDKYLYIRLAPVNYSVASNEDIFKFIKYDILRQLNKTHSIFQVIEDDLNSNNTLANSAYLSLWLLMQNVPDLIKGLIMTLPELAVTGGTLIGAAVVSGVERIENNFKEHQKIKDRILKFNNSPEAEDFFKEIEKKYLYENDPITIFITEILSIISELECNSEDEPKEPKKKVLIIDDLDRLDPEHTFRLFNVFSSHFDYHQEYENKFGFDKIIFCGDIENIRQIFHAKYGLNTDFTGYIDKFYSSEIFYFDNRKSIALKVKEILSSIKTTSKSTYFIHTPILKQNLIHQIVTMFVFQNVVSIRHLKSTFENGFEYDEYNLTGEILKENEFIPITESMIFLKLLNQLLGGYLEVLKCVESCEKLIKSLQQTYYEKYLHFMLPLKDIDNHKFKQGEYECNLKSTSLNYKIMINPEYPIFRTINISNYEKINSQISTQDIYDLFIENIQVAKNLGILK